MTGADHIKVSPEALATSRRLHLEIATAIEAAGGWIPFSQFMHMALYTPGLGYYAAGSIKLADFGLAAGSLVVVTAIMFLQLIFLIVSVWLFCKC